MKHTIKNSLAALLLLAMGVVGCSKENVVVDNQDTTDVPMSITVNDKGYTDIDPSTRTKETGHETVFTRGDKIGVYMVKNGVIVKDNILFDYDGTSWIGPNLNYGGTGAKYFAYYPYQSKLSGNLKHDANTAADFFGDVISKWTPSTDQSTHAKYTAQDLMVSKGVASKEGSGYSLAFDMAHTMGLVVIELPQKTYAFKNNPKSYTVTITGNEFTNFKPLFFTDPTTYRILVKPNQKSGVTDLIGKYRPMGGNLKTYNIPQNDIAPSSYKYYKVDNGVETISHTLQAGDYYLKDGSLIGKDKQLTSDQKAACVGIVFWLVDATKTDPILAKECQGCVHGLVVAKYGQSSVRWQNYRFGESVHNWLSRNNYYNKGFKSVGTWEGGGDPLDVIQGYNNTEAIKEFNKGNTSMPVNIVINALSNYISQHSFPGLSSGWYLPSTKELYILCGGRDNNSISFAPTNLNHRNFINGQLSRAGGHTLVSDRYWTSTESLGYSDQIFVMGLDDGRVTKLEKDRDNWSHRFVLAF